MRPKVEGHEYPFPGPWTGKVGDRKGYALRPWVPPLLKFSISTLMVQKTIKVASG